MEIVKQVLYEEAAIIKINEPHREICQQNPETGEIMIQHYFIRNFLNRHNLTKHLTSIKTRDMKEKPYECMICHRRFHYKNCLVKHHKNVHKDFVGVY